MDEQLTFLENGDSGKRCTRCGIVKQLSEYYTSRNRLGKFYAWNQCKPCSVEVAQLRKKRLKATNPAKLKERWRQYTIKNKYGITLTQYDVLCEQQNGRCAVCGQQPEDGKLLHIDHDHFTGQIRNLLCNNCNTAIGFLEEDLSTIESLYKYIDLHHQKRYQAGWIIGKDGIERAKEEARKYWRRLWPFRILPTSCVGTLSLPGTTPRQP